MALLAAASNVRRSGARAVIAWQPCYIWKEVLLLSEVIDTLHGNAHLLCLSSNWVWKRQQQHTLLGLAKTLTLLH